MTTPVTTTVSPAMSEYKTHALIAYILFTVGLFTAIPILIGAVWAMIKKKGALGTPYHSHLVNTTRVFWWSIFWTILGAILAPFIIGFGVWAIAWLWALYRMINGFAKILSDQPYPI